VTGTLTIATFATFAGLLLTPSIAIAAERHSQLLIRTIEVHPDDAATAVRCGDADVAFGIDYPDAPVPHAAGLDVLRIATERFGVGVAATKRLDPVLRLSDLAREQCILPPENSNCRRAIFTACRRAGFEPNVVHNVEDPALSLTLAAQGLGITITTPMTLALLPAPGLTCHEVADDVHRDLVAICRPSARQRPSIAAVIDIIREFVAPFDRPHDR
jgi:DNA-binding transcriptional LysR family regulator